MKGHYLKVLLLVIGGFVLFATTRQIRERMLYSKLDEYTKRNYMGQFRTNNLPRVSPRAVPILLDWLKYSEAPDTISRVEDILLQVCGLRAFAPSAYLQRLGVAGGIL